MINLYFFNIITLYELFFCLSIFCNNSFQVSRGGKFSGFLYVQNTFIPPSHSYDSLFRY